VTACVLARDRKIASGRKLSVPATVSRQSASHWSQSFSGWFVNILLFADSWNMNAFPKTGKATHKFVLFSARGRPDSHFAIVYKSPSLSVSGNTTRASSATLPSQDNGALMQIIDLVEGEIGHTRCATRT